MLCMFLSTTIDVYAEMLNKAKGKVSALPIVCTAMPGPDGDTVYRIDDIIGEVMCLFMRCLY